MMPLVESDVVTQLLFDRVHDVHLSDMLQLLGGELTSEAFIMLVLLPGDSHKETMYNAIKGKVHLSESGWVGAMTGRQIPIIVFREERRSYRSQANSLVQQLLMLRQRESSGDLCIGIGRPYAGLENVKLSYQEALLASAQMEQPARHRFYGESETGIPITNGKQDKESEKQFIENIRQGKWETVREAVMSLLDRHDQHQTPLPHSAQDVLERLWIITRVAEEMGIEVEKPLFSFQVTQHEQLRAETDGLLSKLIACIVAYQSSVQPDAARQMKQYIMENSDKDITLEGMAQRIGLSPFYMSKMFKDHEGINYIDFLTECRIEKAKKLMADPERSLKEITFEIGYNDPNYFSKVFKKVCGASPSDYRKTIFGH
ncbi:helix-turn-helix domain-containing protein [Paenibacillus sp. LHD-38]|uniref:helix-turn-helix domain-containing protein n=1 Tax=Paenibacillus sp. LHD-38 TaxID=3072143 RepID=UPI00280DECF6|nr:helix-turn-helix domain-containing protein [Paenibacillus sp. LHD-38]MDQ8737651.1 helix-turn-helix domain-containing protein [Paenibacillus sp. LHD-38]